MLPTREGRFKAVIREHGVSESGPNNLVTFVVQFGLIAERSGEEWISVNEPWEITGYFYLEKRDGSLNTFTIDNLKAAFGWDGSDPFWLQDTDFSSVIVQVQLAFETYNGQTRIKVKWIDSENATPTGVKKGDDAARRSIATRLGAKFRANAGGTSAPAPKPITPKPAVPAAPAAAPPATTTAVDINAAWRVFTAAMPESLPQTDIEKEWFRILRVLFPEKAPQALTPAEWRVFLERFESMLTPF